VPVPGAVQPYTQTPPPGIAPPGVPLPSAYQPGTVPQPAVQPGVPGQLSVPALVPGQLGVPALPTSTAPQQWPASTGTMPLGGTQPVFAPPGYVPSAQVAPAQPGQVQPGYGPAPVQPVYAPGTVPGGNVGYAAPAQPGQVQQFYPPSVPTAGSSPVFPVGATQPLPGMSVVPGPNRGAQYQWVGPQPPQQWQQPQPQPQQPAPGSTGVPADRRSTWDPNLFR
jgi:hypothetical protein